MSSLRQAFRRFPLSRGVYRQQYAMRHISQARSKHICATNLHSRSLSIKPIDPTAPSISGFSHPGARKLSEIVKIQLFNKVSAARASEIWSEYHKDHKSAIGDVFTSEEYGLLRQRTERCRHFILPVMREGGYFVLLMEWQGKQCFMTFLEDYKKNPSMAQPYLTLSLYDELLDTKDIVLMRGEVGQHLKVQEGKVLMELVKQFYLGERKNFDAVVAFNENSKDFDFEYLLKMAGKS